jgi:hypothetical protein
VGGDLVEERVAGHDGLHEQGLEFGQGLFEGGQAQQLDDVHFLQTIGQDAEDRHMPGGRHVRVRMTLPPVDFRFSD